jgi:hypothetical protein
MEVTKENYFEAAQALYWYCVDNHGGMSCPLYSILSARLGYTPSCSELGVNDDDDSGLFYNALENGEIEAENLLTAIHEAVGDVQKDE